VIIDEAGPHSPLALNGATWETVTDTVMGGLSRATLCVAHIAGREALHLVGEVRLEHRGGFVQCALDLAGPGMALDARDYAGIEVTVLGNGERYGLHLRTTANRQPWESWRQSFTAAGAWQTLRLPFASFLPHRCTGSLDLARLRRVGLVGIGREFHADFALSRIAFYRADAT
jgi:hypothetical protein